MDDPLRLRHMHGEWLFARDLRDGPRLPAQRLAQHQIAAHHSWGCSAGLGVRYEGGRLTVMPGCGIDRCGRTAVLDQVFVTSLAENTETVVVLELCGDGPRARVRLRDAARVRDLDIRLGRLDASGGVAVGDGDRDWLRRPGPIRQFGGTIARGTTASGTATLWTVHVELATHRLPDTPAVIAHAAGAPASAATSGTTVNVTGLNRSGFDLVVRHSLPAGVPVPRTEVFTAPHAIAWMALLPAERPSFPDPQE